MQIRFRLGDGVNSLFRIFHFAPAENRNRKLICLKLDGKRRAFPQTTTPIRSFNMCHAPPEIPAEFQMEKFSGMRGLGINEVISNYP